MVKEQGHLFFKRIDVMFVRFFLWNISKTILGIFCCLMIGFGIGQEWDSNLFYLSGGTLYQKVSPVQMKKDHGKNLKALDELDSDQLFINAIRIASSGGVSNVLHPLGTRGISNMVFPHIAGQRTISRALTFLKWSNFKSEPKYDVMMSTSHVLGLYQISWNNGWPIVRKYLERHVSIDTMKYSFIQQGSATGGRLPYIEFFKILPFILVLLTCLNYMGIILSRSIKWYREIGVRKVIGARKGTLRMRFFTEVFVQIVMAMILAAVLMELALPLINTITSSQLDINLYQPKLYFSILVMAFLMLILAGLYPAMQLAALPPLGALEKEFQTKGFPLPLRKALLSIQVVIAVILIVCLGTIWRQLPDVQEKAPYHYFTGNPWDSEFNTHSKSMKPMLSPSKLSQGDNQAITIKYGDSKQTLAYFDKEDRHDGEQPFRSKSLGQNIERNHMNIRKVWTLLISCSLVSLFMVFLGIWGIAIQLSNAHQREFAVRRVLGAGTISIFIVLSKNFIKPLLLAFSIAIPVSSYIGVRWLESFAIHASMPWGSLVGAILVIIFNALVTICAQTYTINKSNWVGSLRMG